MFDEDHQTKEPNTIKNSKSSDSDSLKKLNKGGTRFKFVDKLISKIKGENP